MESPPNQDNGSGGVASTAVLLSLIPDSSDRTVTLPIDFYKVRLLSNASPFIVKIIWFIEFSSKSA